VIGLDQLTSLLQYSLYSQCCSHTTAEEAESFERERGRNGQNLTRKEAEDIG